MAYRRKHGPITDDVRMRIIKYYLDGITQNAIANTFNISKLTVGIIIKEYRAKTDPPGTVRGHRGWIVSGT